MAKQPDDRPPFVVAYEWSARITSICIELVVPVLAGYWLDHRWGTFPWLILAGIAIGMAVAVLGLVRLAKTPVDQRHDAPRK